MSVIEDLIPEAIPSHNGSRRYGYL